MIPPVPMATRTYLGCLFLTLFPECMSIHDVEVCFLNVTSGRCWPDLRFFSIWCVYPRCAKPNAFHHECKCIWGDFWTGPSTFLSLALSYSVTLMGITLVSPRNFSEVQLRVNKCLPLCHSVRFSKSSLPPNPGTPPLRNLQALFRPCIIIHSSHLCCP